MRRTRLHELLYFEIEELRMKRLRSWAEFDPPCSGPEEDYSEQDESSVFKPSWTLVSKYSDIGLSGPGAVRWSQLHCGLI